MVHGLVVVTTPIGAKGIASPFPGVVATGGDPKAFAAATVQALEDRERWEAKRSKQTQREIYDTYNYIPYIRPYT